MTVAGLNELMFRWPLPGQLGEGGLTRLAAQLEQGIAPDMSPALGEIHALSVREAGVQ